MTMMLADRDRLVPHPPTIASNLCAASSEPGFRELANAARAMARASCT
ncbi:MAG: hypothetical protein HOP29_04590 [Phycisphaerales bacterium]|nr:hypothetical protein [Phycisphaerales bacterium]